MTEHVCQRGEDWGRAKEAIEVLEEHVKRHPEGPPLWQILGSVGGMLALFATLMLAYIHSLESHVWRDQGRQDSQIARMTEVDEQSLAMLEALCTKEGLAVKGAETVGAGDKTEGE